MRYAWEVAGLLTFSKTNATVGKIVLVSLDCFAPRLAGLKHNILSMGRSQGFFDTGACNFGHTLVRDSLRGRRQVVCFKDPILLGFYESYPQ